MLGNVQVVPIAELKVAEMSFAPESRSLPRSLFASACEYQVSVNGAPGKFPWTVVAPAWPSVALDGPHVSGFIWAPTRIVTALESSAPQMSAAY